MSTTAVASILQIIFFLEDGKLLDSVFDRESNTLDMHSICTNIQIIETFAFIATFYGKYKCNPSRKIVFDRRNIQTMLSALQIETYKSQFTRSPSRLKKQVIDTIYNYKVATRTTDNKSYTKNIIQIFIEEHASTKTFLEEYDSVLHANIFGFVNRPDKRVAFFTDNDEYCCQSDHVWVFKTNKNVHPLNTFDRVIKLVDNKYIVIDDKFKITLPNVSFRAEVVTALIQVSVHALKFWELVSQKLWHPDASLTCMKHGNHVSKNALVAIDNRQNPLTVLACLMSCAMLDRSKWKEIVVFCNALHVEYYQARLRDATIIALPELSTCTFSFDLYNSLLKSTKIWKVLKEDRGVDRCLMVQDDGFLIREGVERFLEYDYVGAPWREGQGELRELTNPELVGNGGLSIRNVDVMLDITTSNQGKEMDPRIPEDVFFSREVWVRGHKVCPRELAGEFASEQVANPRCCGVHKPWPYTTIKDLELLLIS